MAGQPQDAKDLDEFARSGSAEAFARLSRRYAGLVYRVCLRRLGSEADAEDASQAVFVALARKAGSVKPARLASWLHGASIRAAQFIARSRANRARYEREAAEVKSQNRSPRGTPDREALGHLDAEIGKLPSKLREAVARHYLAGLSRSELASELGVPEGTVQSRLNAGLEKLRARLGGRGVRLGAATLGTLLASEAGAGAPASLMASLPALVSGAAAGGAVGGAGAGVSLIAEGVLKAMLWTKIKIAVAAVAAVTVVAGVGTPLTVKAVAGGKGEGPVVAAKPSVVKARVTAVKPSPVDGPATVTIDRGSEHGVKPGFVFHITRDGKEINEFTVKGLAAKQASGKVKFASAWVPARIVKVGDLASTKLTVIDQQPAKGPVAGPAPTPAAREDTVYVKMLSGSEKPRHGGKLAERWILAETAKLGSAAATDNTKWIPLGKIKGQIYASRQGGRLVEGREVSRGKQVAVEFTGRRTSELPKTVRLPNRPGARSVVKITNYPGAGNHFLAVRIGPATLPVIDNGLRLKLIPSWAITLKPGATVTHSSGHVWRPGDVILCEITEERPDAYSIFAYSGKRWKGTVKKADIAVKEAKLNWAKLRWENVSKKPLVIYRDRCCDLYDHVFMKGPDGKLVPARRDNRERLKHLGHQPVRLEPGKSDAESFHPWHWVVKPTAPGEYTLWVEYERKPPAKPVGPFYWTGKVRSNPIGISLGKAGEEKVWTGGVPVPRIKKPLADPKEVF